MAYESHKVIARESTTRIKHEATAQFAPFRNISSFLFLAHVAKIVMTPSTAMAYHRVLSLLLLTHFNVCIVYTSGVYRQNTAIFHFADDVDVAHISHWHTTVLSIRKPSNEWQTN